MRILVLGAGATGGFFGGRAFAIGRDVTFLVREARRARLDRDGLRIESKGRTESLRVPAVTSAELRGPYDAVVLSCKAYDLDAAIAAIRPAVGENTLVLPLLNGMRHLDGLDRIFGLERVLGGTCHISVSLDTDGTIRHLSPFASLTLGARTPGQRDAAAAIHGQFEGAGFDARLSDDVIAAMWEKWILLATLAGSTCLMRASIGEIVATGAGPGFITDMIDECAHIAAAGGYPAPGKVLDTIRKVLTDPASRMSASMRRDVEAGHRVEADHILGDLIARGEAAGVEAPLLHLAYAQLEAYQQRIAVAA